ncbi:MAG TPA: tRNA uridine-5-carboxymethylaminomethyl(34) synthesis GTPase MnmE [Nitrospirae bacterium]|nr:tRNA uridine-5-carboxymethylaminomethyl(34) synthesis GTPase MnmE [Nitrospirota bacterium]
MTLTTKDTIAAISTPIGTGGIGIIRVSGIDAITIVDKVFVSKKEKKLSNVKSHTIHYGYIFDDKTNEIIDEVLVTVMKSPHSYTCEDTVEINCHGGYLSLSKTLNLLLSRGARFAQPGEFTMRAFLNGRIDLSQAEAVMDLINSKTDIAHKNALSQLEGLLQDRINNILNELVETSAYIEAHIDFPEDDIGDIDKSGLLDQIDRIKCNIQNLSNSFNEGKYLKEGLAVSIIGKPNVGKSSLLNCLLMKNRAIVTDIPGTTRDIIEEMLNIKGLPVKIIDTAGIRDAENIIEKEGIMRSKKSIELSDIILAVFDSSALFDEQDLQIVEMIKGKKCIIVLNKCDLNKNLIDLKFFENFKVSHISALKGQGIDELKDTLFELAVGKDSAISQGDFLITSQRHKFLLDSTTDALNMAIEKIITKQPLEIVALYIRESIDSLSEITGAVRIEEILNKIFEGFCIGK